MRIADLGFGHRGYLKICDNHPLYMYPFIETGIIFMIPMHEFRKYGITVCGWDRACRNPMCPYIRGMRVTFIEG